MREIITTLVNYAFEGVWEFIGAFLLFALFASVVYKILKYVAEQIWTIVILCSGKTERILEVFNSEAVKEIVDEKIEDIVKEQLNQKLGTILSNALDKTNKDRKENNDE